MHARTASMSLLERAALLVFHPLHPTTVGHLGCGDPHTRAHPQVAQGPGFVPGPPVCPGFIVPGPWWDMGPSLQWQLPTGVVVVLCDTGRGDGSVHCTLSCDGPQHVAIGGARRVVEWLRALAPSGGVPCAHPAPCMPFPPPRPPPHTHTHHTPSLLNSVHFLSRPPRFHAAVPSCSVQRCFPALPSALPVPCDLCLCLFPLPRCGPFASCGGPWVDPRPSDAGPGCRGCSCSAGG
jgi:hypothetical protein